MSWMRPPNLRLATVFDVFWLAGRRLRQDVTSAREERDSLQGCLNVSSSQAEQVVALLKSATVVQAIVRMVFATGRTEDVLFQQHAFSCWWEANAACTLLGRTAAS